MAATADSWEYPAQRKFDDVVPLSEVDPEDKAGKEQLNLLQPDSTREGAYRWSSLQETDGTRPEWRGRFSLLNGHMIEYGRSRWTGNKD